jgi:hypothetical protein
VVERHHRQTQAQQGGIVGYDGFLLASRALFPAGLNSD